MPIDPLSPRIMAPAIALGGLGTMMTAPEPNWHSAGIGLACLIAFAGLSLVPAPKPSRRQSGARGPSKRIARGVSAVPDYRPPDPGAPDLAAPDLAAPRGLNDPHPVLFRGMRSRQSRLSK